MYEQILLDTVRKLRPCSRVSYPQNRDGFESWVWRDQLKLATDVYGLIEDVRLKGGRLGSWLREAL